MNKLLLTTLMVFTLGTVFAQTPQELFEKENYLGLVQFEKDADKLSPEELYMVGYAFFQLENNKKAIEFYDRAIKNGLDSDYVHYFKGLVLRLTEQFDDAVKEFDIAIKKDPANQKYLTEKGFAYYYDSKLDKALAIFLEAQKLPNTYELPFYMAPHIYHLQEHYEKALKGFYEALNHISKDNEYYVSTLADIGRLEYAVTKDFVKSAKAYSEAISVDKKNYGLYSPLMRAYNASKEYAKADSIFGLMKIAYNNKELPEEDMKYGNVVIDEDEWNGQKLMVWRNFVDSEKALDISYQVYLLNKAGDKIERTFVVEKTLPFDEGPKHLLCETNKKTGAHYTYPYGWKTDTIPLDDLKKAVVLILNGKMKFSAASNFGGK